MARPSSISNNKSEASIKSYEGREKAWAIAERYALERINSVDPQTNAVPEKESPFLACDLGEVLRQHQRWKHSLPRVHPHYAIKANPEHKVVELLAKLGVSFDCSSSEEIDQALLYVDASKIIYAHPRKDLCSARCALNQGVVRTTCDSLSGIKMYGGNFLHAELLIRIATDDSDSECRLTDKFGAGYPFHTARDLLRVAQEYNVNIVGVSFHVGSNSSNPAAFAHALQAARMVFDQAKDFGFDLSILDIGGGFTSDIFEEQADAVNVALNQYFADLANITIIGEPGRFYIASSTVLACKVVDHRSPAQDVGLQDFDNSIDLNAGIYGVLANMISDHQVRKPKFLRRLDASSIKPTKCRIWGPTCDGYDKLPQAKMPGWVNDGDWLWFDDMGAYTVSCACTFNGHPIARVHFVSSEPEVSALMGWGYRSYTPALEWP